MHGHAIFAGIAFRAQSSTDYELIYLWPHLSRQPDALQYTPIFNGSEAWQLYSGDGYTAAAELPLNRWVHVEPVVAGYQARLTVDGAAEPQLIVTTLKRPWVRGLVGFWGALGGANFSNLTVRPSDTAAPPPLVEAPPNRRTLMTWDLSRSFDTASQPNDELPAGAAQPAFEWQTVTASAPGSSTSPAIGRAGAVERRPHRPQSGLRAEHDDGERTSG